jgi:hypothetical protein|tara:strand:+ start:155 stop:313 length:159 start_codon:yes stop_codon:yes gene_type:complete
MTDTKEAVAKAPEEDKTIKTKDYDKDYASLREKMIRINSNQEESEDRSAESR